MKAIVLTGRGAMEKLEYVDFPKPVAAEDEVLIEVHACGMNNTDVWVRQGHTTLLATDIGLFAFNPSTRNLKSNARRNRLLIH
ncbi:MAG: hypothetical protein WBM41_08210 [Arenicellales bacterium]